MESGYIGFKADQRYREKLDQLAAESGWTISTVLRKLIDAAEIQSITRIKVATKRKAGRTMTSLAEKQ